MPITAMGSWSPALSSTLMSLQIALNARLYGNSGHSKGSADSLHVSPLGVFGIQEGKSGGQPKGLERTKKGVHDVDHNHHTNR